MEKEKRKGSPASRRATYISYFLIAVTIAFVVIMVLALLGPTQGNVFSNIIRGGARGPR